MSFEHSRPSRRGFTLLEVVCTLIILGVLGGLVFSGFSSALKGYAQMKTSSATFMQAELALIRLQKELSGMFDQFQYTEGSSEMAFHRADGISVSFRMEGENLFLKVDNTVVILLSGVRPSQEGLFLVRREGDSLPYLITVSFTLDTELGTRDYTLSVSPRNTPPAKG